MTRYSNEVIISKTIKLSTERIITEQTQTYWSFGWLGERNVCELHLTSVLYLIKSNGGLIKMEIENRLSIINKHLDSAIMEISATWERDKLLEAQSNIKRVIWGIKKDKVFDRKYPDWKKKDI